MSEGIFRHPYRVTYADCAIGNHVYYSRYLNFLEAARGEFFRHLGLTFLELQMQDTILPVVECRFRYKAPARYDDILTIELWVTAVERVRLNFGYRVVKSGGHLLAEAETMHICAGMDEKPKRLPEELISRIQPYLRAAKQSA
jgi:acyl-CoA thioester hydrolase